MIPKKGRVGERNSQVGQTGGGSVVDSDSRKTSVLYRNGHSIPPKRDDSHAIISSYNKRIPLNKNMA